MSLGIGLDVGTQSTKGLVLDLEAGRVLARAARPYDLIDGLAPGAAEQHPDTWAAAVAAVRQKAEMARDRRIMTVSHPRVQRTARFGLIGADSDQGTVRLGTTMRYSPSAEVVAAMSRSPS